jgi:cytochrome c
MQTTKYLTTLFIAGAMLTTQAIAANDATPLAQKSGCFACHSIDKKVMGPAWKDVAAKYRGDASAEAKLVTKVSKGGSGVWGTMAMPAQAPKVQEADIKTLVKFVLSLK